MESIEQRNKNYQKSFDYQRTQERNQKQIISLRVKKRKNLLNKNRIVYPSLAIPIPSSLSASFPMLTKNQNREELISSLFKTCFSEREDHSVTALGYLSEIFFTQHEDEDYEASLEILEGITGNLLSMNQEIHLKTLSLLLKIYTVDSKISYQFNKSLIDKLIKSLSSNSMEIVVNAYAVVYSALFTLALDGQTTEALLKALNRTTKNPHFKSKVKSENLCFAVMVYQILNFRLVESEELFISAVGDLKYWVKDANQDIKFNAIKSIIKITQVKDDLQFDLQDIFCDLIKCLESECLRLVKVSLQLIVLVLAGSDQDAQLFINLGLIEKLITMNFYAYPFAKLVGYCLGNLFAGTEQQIILLLNHRENLIGNLLCSNDPDLYYEGVFCLKNAVCKNSNTIVSKILELKIVPILIQNMTIEGLDSGRDCGIMILNIFKKVKLLARSEEWIELIKSLQDRMVYEHLGSLVLMNRNMNNSLYLESICKIIEENEELELNLNPPARYEF